MHLKTLTLKGFKSFAEPAVIRLEPGVTAVVGPNGSGKSNVVDAVAWVLGAQAPSSVRSTRMDDVIFAGTARKPELGRAEVSLTIDNSDGTLPVASSEVRITRTLFRGGESSYALNGAPCRLLDVAELLSDTGVGRRQHVIVSQSQIDAVLNARPEDRRAVIEEAAGVLKYRKRRERAERRLLATDGDLIRINDLIREVRRRLRPLQAQAEAARRHADLVAELGALRVHLAGREIESLRRQLREHRATAEAREAQEAGLRNQLDALRLDAADREQRLAAHGADDHSERLARLEGLRARAAGLEALLGERFRSIERERAVLVGHDLAAGLAAETERCRRDLADIESMQAESAAARGELTRLEARLEAERADHEARWGALPDVDGREAAEARGELAARREACRNYEAERDRLTSRLGALEERLRTLGHHLARHERDLRRCRADAASLDRERTAAETECAEAKQAAEAAAQHRAETESEMRHWTARREALSLADTGAEPAPAAGLARVEGVLGALSDLVEIDAGAEAAFAAAVGEAVGALVVENASAARRVLDSLKDSDVGAAVIALESVGSVGTTVVPGAAQDPTGKGASPLRRRVRAAHPDIGRLLDRLLAATVMVEGDWLRAADVAAADARLVVVTAAGDRFSSRGWRLGVHSAAGVRAALTEAVERTEAASEATEHADEALERARALQAERQAAAESVSARLSAAERGASAASEALDRAETDRRDLQAAAAALRDHISDTDRRLSHSADRAKQIEARLEQLEVSEARAQKRNAEAAEARAGLERRAAELADRLAELRITEARLAQRSEMLEARLAELAERTARHGETQAAARARLGALDRQSAVIEALRNQLAGRAVSVNAGLTEIRELRRRHSEQAQVLAVGLDGLRRRCVGLETQLDELRREASIDDVEEARLRTLLQGAVERLRDDHGMTPSEAISAPAPSLHDGLEPDRRVEQLCSELEIMGPVNPLALAEFEELTERHDLLRDQLDDIRAARRDLNRVIRSIDNEIRSVFSAAFVDVAANFEVLFDALFPGGEGRLALTDPEDLLATGVEISAKPSGKNVRRLSLLSGGERSLAALAFLFAVFRSRPSPFYLLDEVEAALDDVNLNRFLKLVDEFRSDAQLVIVTHQKRTMEAADCLHGVSMKPGGASVVVSERVSEAA